MQFKSLIKYSIISIIIITLLFFLYAFKFVGLATDDYCRAFWSFSDFFENISNWYYHHNGRFINAFLSALPVYNNDTLSIVLSLLFISLPSTILFFANRLFNLQKASIPFFYKLLTALVLCILILIKLKSVSQYFYWYAAATVYAVSIILLLLFLSFLLGIQTGKKWNQVGAMITGFLLVGNNELFIIATNAIVMLSLFMNIYFKNKNLLGKYLLVLATVLTGSIIVLISPGSASRQEAHTSGGKFLYSVYHSVVETIKILYEQITSIENVLTLLVLLIISIVISIKSNIPKSFIHPILLAVISLSLIVSFLFVPYYAVGFFVEKEGRVGNVIEIIVLLALFVNMFNGINFIFARWNNSLRFRELTFMLLLVPVLLALFAISSNLNDLYDDYREDSFLKMAEQKASREQTILTFEGEDLIVESYVGSRTVENRDISSQADFWSNECYVDYWNILYNKNFSTIIVK